MKRLIAALLCLPALAFAGSGNYVDSGVFTSVPGYGYEVKASYTTNVGDFTFATNFIDNFDAGNWSKSFAAGVSAYAAFPQSAEVIDFSVSLDVRFVNLATGKTEFPAFLWNRANIPQSNVLTAGAFGSGSASYGPPSQPELRFSYSTLTQSLSVADQNKVINPGGGSNGYSTAFCAKFGPCQDIALAPKSVHLQFSGSFNAGNFLMPSSDPSCASFSCMVPGHDALHLAPLSVNLAVSSAPEPTTYALFALGLAVLSITSRRRSRAS